QPLPKPIRRLLPAALLGDERLDPLLDAVVAQTRRAFFEVVPELVARLRRAFTVQQRPYFGDHRRALRVLGIYRTDRWGPAPVFAHDDTSSGVSSCSPRKTPRRLRTSDNRSRSWR